MASIIAYTVSYKFFSKFLKIHVQIRVRRVLFFFLSLRCCMFMICKINHDLKKQTKERIIVSKKNVSERSIFREISHRNAVKSKVVGFYTCLLHTSVSFNYNKSVGTNHIFKIQMPFQNRQKCSLDVLRRHPQVKLINRYTFCLVYSYDSELLEGNVK